MPAKKDSTIDIFLRPMTAEEYPSWQEKCRADYAKEKESEGLSPEDALAVAEKSFRDLLPQGVASPDQHLYMIVEKASGQAAGFFWWGVQTHGQRRIAWVYNIQVDSKSRGRGWGRAAMVLGEAEVKAAGFSRFGLHVFGYNTTARKLYQSLGFAETNVVMYKDL